MTRLLWLIVCPFLLLNFQQVSMHELRLSPSPGTRVSKSFEITLQTRLDALEQEMDGEPFDAAPTEMEESSTTSLRFIDDFGSFENGQPTVVHREFELLEGQLAYKLTGVMGKREATIPKASALQGKRVVFTWDKEAKAYATAYKESSDANTKMLASLRQATDLGAFLPSAGVAEGNSWTVDAKHLEEILSPGGDVKLRLKGEEASAERPPGDRWDNLQGDVSATFRGLRSSGERRVAVVELKASVTAKDSRQQGTVSEASENALELAGELLWDVAANRPHALSLTGTIRQSLSRSGTEEDEDDTYTFVERSRYSGTMTVRATWADVAEESDR